MVQLRTYVLFWKFWTFLNICNILKYLHLSINAALPPPTPPLLSLPLSLVVFSTWITVSFNLSMKKWTRHYWKSETFTFSGIGWGMFFVSLFTSIYYNVIISWCFFYMFASFARDVPWRECNNWWNTKGVSSVFCIAEVTS